MKWKRIGGWLVGQFVCLRGLGNRSDNKSTAVLVGKQPIRPFVEVALTEQGNAARFELIQGGKSRLLRELPVQGHRRRAAMGRCFLQQQVHIFERFDRLEKYHSALIWVLLLLMFPPLRLILFWLLLFQLAQNTH